MQYEQKQIWWMRMRWTMICKMNEMEMNDDMNELDFLTWNEYMNFGGEGGEDGGVPQPSAYLLIPPT